MAGKRGYRPPSDYDPRRGRGKGGKRRPAHRKSGQGSSSGSAAPSAPRQSRPRDEDQDAAREAQRPRSKAAEGHAAREIVSRPHSPRHQGSAAAASPAFTLTTASDIAGRGFTDLELGGNIVRTLGELGAEQPFPIQVATIPDTVRGRDVLGKARTGSGKTIAFGAGIVERLLRLKAEGAFASDPAPPKRRRGEPTPKAGRSRQQTRKPKALILAPTRELALQIDRTVQPIARSVGFYTAQLVGGVPLEPQMHALERGVDIVIGTPGRVRDLVNRRHLDLREVRVSVIDEADHMCELGFLEATQWTLRQTRRGGQRLLFSATLDGEVATLVEEFLRDPAAHEVEEASALDVEHRVCIVLREHKDDALVELASGRDPAPSPRARAGLPADRVIVFCRTRAYTEHVAELLTGRGISAVALHGDLSQARRERNLAKFSEGRARVLVATDVAARGIHVDGVDLVVQADPPDDPKGYLHRAGRTARAGATGRVVTVIPRTRQKRTRELFEALGIVPASFTDFVPRGDAGRDA